MKSHFTAILHKTFEMLLRRARHSVTEGRLFHVYQKQANQVNEHSENRRTYVLVTRPNTLPHEKLD